MKEDLQRELQEKTQWSRADVERLARARPGIMMWTFAPGSHFDDDALIPLEGARKLRFLSFANATLSGDHLMVLTRLPVIVRLNLIGSRFTPGDFATFCAALAANGSPKLSELWLENTSIGDDDLRALGEIPRLRWLILSGTDISNAGLKYLHSLMKLETLWLDRTGVSDEGVLGLAVLPRLTGLPTRETACSPDIREQLFVAQTARQTAKKSPNEAQARAAEARLREFLQAMEEWERAAYQRADVIEKEFRAQRPHPHVYAEAEARANEIFWREINQQKAVIADRFCSRKLRDRGAGRAGSYGSPPRFQTQTGDWLAVETPSSAKTRFTGNDGFQGKRRYTLILEDGDWRVDEVQLWSGGWKRDHV